MTGESDASLAERVRAGDTGAFETLFRNYYAGLVRFALHYVGGDQAVAEDIAHDVFYRVWEQRAQWRVQTTIATYLYGATRNRCIDYARHRAVEGRLQRDVIAGEEAGDLPLPLVTPVPAADESLEVRELETAVARAVARLPERCRQAFVLHRDHGLTYEEIGGVMGTSPKTVKAQMGRALKGLRAALAPFLTP